MGEQVKEMLWLGKKETHTHSRT